MAADGMGGSREVDVVGLLSPVTISAHAARSSGTSRQTITAATFRCRAIAIRNET